MARKKSNRRIERSPPETPISYKTLAENLPGVVYRVFLQQNGRMQFFNELLQEITGYEPDELTAGKVCAVEPFILSDDRARVISTMRQAIAENQPFEVEYRFQHKNGDIRAFIERGKPIQDLDGTPLYIDGIILDITERRQVEQALQQSEQTLKKTMGQIEQAKQEWEATVDVLPLIVFLLDDQRAILRANRAVERWGLCQVIDVAGREVHDLFHPGCADDSCYLEGFLQRAWEKATRGEPTGCEADDPILERCLNLQIQPVSPTMTTFQGASALFAAFTVHDITERKRTEEALRKAAERLNILRDIDRAILQAQSMEEIARAAMSRIRALVPCLGAGVVMVNLEHNTVTIFAADTELEIQPGMSFSMEPLGDVQGFVGILGQREIYVVEDIPSLSLASLDGQVFQTGKMGTAVIVPLVSPEGLFGFLTLGVEQGKVLDQEQVEIVQEAADHLALVIQNARLLQIERRRSAELETLRQASLHLTSSLQLEAVLGIILEHALELISADNAHIFLYDGERLSFGAALWDEGYQSRPYAEPRPDGLTHVVARSGERVVVPDMKTHPLFVDQSWDGAILGLPLHIRDQVVGVMNIAFVQPHSFDESELQILELLADQAAVAIQNARLHQQVQRHAQDLSAALDQAKELDQLKDEFVQNVSHELRQPLALIRGHAEMLNLGELGALQPEQKESVSVIVRRARMLGDMVQDIMLLMEAESDPPQSEVVLLGELVHLSVQDFQMVVRQSGSKLQAEVAPGLPPVDVPLTYMRRVLDNLIGNALKFTPQGGSVTVRTFQEGEWVILQVEDTGIGIPTDRIEQIFDRFFQIDGSSRRRYDGVGLGLALVKEIVETYGGQVQVQSTEGQGSTFTVKLPVVQE